MLHLLLGTDWTANRDELLRRISCDVKEQKGNRILMVPELISHETERLLCAWAGDTASRYAEVLSFTRLARRVAHEADLWESPLRTLICLDVMEELDLLTVTQEEGGALRVKLQKRKGKGKVNLFDAPLIQSLQKIAE